MVLGGGQVANDFPFSCFPLQVVLVAVRVLALSAVRVRQHVPTRHSDIILIDRLLNFMSPSANFAKQDQRDCTTDR